MIELEPDLQPKTQGLPADDPFSKWTKDPRSIETVPIPSSAVLATYGRYLAERIPIERRFYVEWLSGLSVEYISNASGFAQDKVLESITRVADGWIQKSPPGNGQTGLPLDPSPDPNALRQPDSVELGTYHLAEEVLKMFEEPDYKPKDAREPELAVVLREAGDGVAIIAEPPLLRATINIWFWHHPEVELERDHDDILATRPLESFDDVLEIEEDLTIEL